MKATAPGEQAFSLWGLESAHDKAISKKSQADVIPGNPGHLCIHQKLLQARGGTEWVCGFWRVSRTENTSHIAH
jgi:hypothetical protein